MELMLEAVIWLILNLAIIVNHIKKSLYCKYLEVVLFVENEAGHTILLLILKESIFSNKSDNYLQWKVLFCYIVSN